MTEKKRVLWANNDNRCGWLVLIDTNRPFFSCVLSCQAFDLE